jgi:hypothetical protein
MEDAGMSQQNPFPDSAQDNQGDDGGMFDDEPQQGGDDMMGGNEMPDANMGGDDNVDSDKKEIQKLAGQLSQKLGEYNNSQQNADVDLNKYVLGMINSQGGKVLSSDEKESIINKLNSEGGDDNEEQMQPGGNDDMPMQNESFNKLDELINDIVSGVNANKPIGKMNFNKKKTSPFSTKR